MIHTTITGTDGHVWTVNGDEKVLYLRTSEDDAFAAGWKFAGTTWRGVIIADFPEPDMSTVFPYIVDVEHGEAATQEQMDELNAYAMELSDQARKLTQ